MTNFQFKSFKFLVVIFSFSLLVFSFCEAAVLYLEPAQGEYQPGDTFIVEARIDTQGECINAAAINLSFSRDILEAIDFSKGNSILSLWLKPLEINQAEGLVSFSGGIPGGYCGRLPGDPGQSNLLGRIIFKVREKNGELFFVKLEFGEDSRVLLNDGFGTPCELTFKGATFNILAGELEEVKDQWQEELEKDKIPPEVFDIEIQQDQSIFEGKYFIIFQTQDKQTGLDYYEVKEGDKNWQKTKSPYLLVDQELKSIIKVRAVDKVGNERIAEYIPEVSKRSSLFWLVLLIFVGFGIIWRIVKKFLISKS